MRRSSKIFCAVGLLLIAGWAISNRNFRGATDGSDSTSLPAWLQNTAAESQSSVAEEPPGQLFTTELTRLVTQRLRDWEDQDDPAQRAERTRELETLLNGADKLDVIAALPPGLSDFAFGLPMFQQWMAAEPATAAEWMRTHPEISEARLFTLLRNWVERDPVAMQAYVSTLPTSVWQQKALAATSHLALTKDPVAAIAWARQMAPDGRRTGLLAIATLNWAQCDPAAATQWVDEVSDGTMRDSLQGSLAIAYAATDPALAAEWAIRAMRPGAALNRSVAEIAGVWAKKEPAAVAAWVMDFPAGVARQQVTENLVNVWANHDRMAVEAWVNALPNAEWRNQGKTLLAALPDATTP